MDEFISVYNQIKFSYILDFVGKWKLEIFISER